MSLCVNQAIAKLTPAVARGNAVFGDACHILEAETMTARKIYEKLLAGSRNIRFEDLCKKSRRLGYRRDRITGSHHIYEHPQATRPLNLQNWHGQA